MGDRVRVQFPVPDIYLGMWPATQVNSAWHPFVGRRNEYQPKDGDVCGWGVNANRWFVCEWQVKLCDPIVTRWPYLSALAFRDKGLIIKKRYINSSVYFLFTYLLSRVSISFLLIRTIRRINREFEFYEFFSFLKFNEFYEFFSVEKKS